LWVKYKKKAIEKSLSSATDTDEEGSKSFDVFNQAGYFFFPTLGRGEKYFGDSVYESNTISDYIPSLPLVGSFVYNGAIAALDDEENKVMVHGSASCYVFVLVCPIDQYIR
jgi:small ligand-binding sensory domain FIST